MSVDPRKRKMNRYGEHLHGNLPTGLKIYYTHDDPLVGEIVCISAVPLGLNWKRNADSKILDLYIKPTLPHNSRQVKIKQAWNYANEQGHERHVAMSLLHHWFDSLNLGMCKLAPLVYNFPQESIALRKWIGNATYDLMIDDGEIRDLRGICAFVNDVVDSRAERHVFGELKLKALAPKLNAKVDYGKVTALTEVAMITDLYPAVIMEVDRRMGI